MNTLADNISLQKDIDKLIKWGETWQMKFNIQKCKSLHVGHNNNNDFYYSIGHEWLNHDTQEKDLGVIVSNDLKPSKQCIEARNKAIKMLGFIRAKVEYKSKDVILKCYNALVRPHLEYCIQQWSPHIKQDIDMLEQVQRKTTRMIPNISHLSYEDRLKEMNLFKLTYRRLRGDLIQVFKIIRGFDKLDMGS